MTKKEKLYRESTIKALIEDQNKDIKLIKEYTEDIPVIKEKINGLSERMDRVEDNIELIKSGIKRKVDVEEFVVLTKRVSILENKLKNI